jgi:hypothetical protein
MASRTIGRRRTGVSTKELARTVGGYGWRRRHDIAGIPSGTNPGFKQRSSHQTHELKSGWRLNWNTQPGLMYQVQTSTDFKTWTNLATVRLAAGQRLDCSRWEP